MKKNVLVWDSSKKKMVAKNVDMSAEEEVAFSQKDIDEVSNEAAMITNTMFGE